MVETARRFNRVVSVEPARDGRLYADGANSERRRRHAQRGLPSTAVAFDTVISPGWFEGGLICGWGLSPCLFIPTASRLWQRHQLCSFRDYSGGGITTDWGARTISAA